MKSQRWLTMLYAMLFLFVCVYGTVIIAEFVWRGIFKVWEIPK